jgi:hypothetical protein
VLIGAGALIVLGAAVTAITLVRRRGAGDRNDESQS